MNSTIESHDSANPLERGSCQRGIAFHLILIKNRHVFPTNMFPLFPSLFLQFLLLAAIDASTHFTLQIRRPVTGMIFLSFVGGKKKNVGNV